MFDSYSLRHSHLLQVFFSSQIKACLKAFFRTKNHQNKQAFFCLKSYKAVHKHFSEAKYWILLLQTNGGNLLDLLYWFVMQQMDVRTTHMYSSEAVQILSYTSINSKVLNSVWKHSSEDEVWRIEDRFWRELQNISSEQENKELVFHQNIAWQRLFWWLLKKLHTELCADVELTIVHSTVSLSHITSNINDSVDSDFYQLQHSTCPIK